MLKPQPPKPVRRAPEPKRPTREAEAPGVDDDEVDEYDRHKMARLVDDPTDGSEGPDA